ncbi:MAG: isoprenoid biosynthesis glyoxalase ElbB [Phycisphaerae bacterium]|nr:isoprenoid biosynthesis glyoxalase ElbB [Phycisphaerae bacterium]
MPKVGVLLSGCGVFDGAEIHESVLTLLALNQRGAEAVCCAPNIEQAAVVDHRTQQPAAEKRNVLTEAARIARGEIRDVADVTAAELDALVIPGGFGAAKNLCNFADAGPECTVQLSTKRLIADMLEARKPVGAICIAPALLARVAEHSNVSATVTIGDDPATARAIEHMGCVHRKCAVTDIVADAAHHVVTTPAYMLGKGPAEVFEGIRKLVDKVLEMI